MQFNKTARHVNTFSEAVAHYADQPVTLVMKAKSGTGIASTPPSITKSTKKMQNLKKKLPTKRRTPRQMPAVP